MPCGTEAASPNQVLTHAARAAAKQSLVAARGAREGLWLEQEAAASRLKVDNPTGLRAQCSRLTAHAFQASASRISKKSRRALPVNFAAAGQTTFGKHKADARRVHDISLNL